MKTCGAMIDAAMLELGLSPSSVDEALRKSVLGRMHEHENAVLDAAFLAPEEISVTLVADQREYRLPPDVMAVKTLRVDGDDLNDYRTTPDKISRIEE